MTTMVPGIALQVSPLREDAPRSHALAVGPTSTATGTPPVQEQVRVYVLASEYQAHEAAVPIDWAAEAAVWGRDSEDWAEEAWHSAGEAIADC